MAGTSQFLCGLHKIKELFRKGVKYILGDGKKIKLWLDVWTRGVPLKVRFHNLFQICKNPKQLACQVVENDLLQIDFRRNFAEKELEELGMLIEIVEGII